MRTGDRRRPGIRAGADGILEAVDLADGRRAWTLDLHARFGTRQNFFGAGATPLVEGGRVIVNVGSPGPCLAALDVSDGRVVWTAGDGWSAGYAAPVAATIHGRRRLLCFTGGDSDPPDGGLLVVDAATGRETWRFPWRGRRRESVNAAPPLCGRRQGHYL